MSELFGEKFLFTKYVGFPDILGVICVQKNGLKEVLLRTLGKQISNHVMAFLHIAVQIARAWKERQ